jgi:hypothetical protein
MKRCKLQLPKTHHGPNTAFFQGQSYTNKKKTRYPVFEAAICEHGTQPPRETQLQRGCMPDCAIPRIA